MHRGLLVTQRVRKLIISFLVVIGNHKILYIIKLVA